VPGAPAGSEDAHPIKITPAAQTAANLDNTAPHLAVADAGAVTSMKNFICCPHLISREIL
jgi:hypothetical protein